MFRRSTVVVCAHWALAAGALIAACACADAETIPRPESVSESAAPTRVVDSIFPIEEEIRRFRALLGPEPTGLSGGLPSRDALVERFADAVSRADTSALVAMLLTQDEFGWLYYPHTMFTHPPYELPPALLWFQIQNGSTGGFTQLMQRLGGRPLGLQGYSCPPEPRAEGPNRVWEGCVVRWDPPDGDPTELALFGSIVERGGVFKFVSYSNGY